MIQLTCTNCKAVLTMDDAFAGGVCRCQHCGTIQTVPSRLKNEQAGIAEPVSQPGAKTLYQRHNRAEVGTGLDDLADVVAGSGISNSGLGSGQLTARQMAAVSKANRTHTLIAVGAAMILLLIGAVIWLLMRPTQSTVSTDASNTGDAPSVQATVEPAFLGLKLEGDTVIYLIDRGSGTQKAFGDLKQAVLRSIPTLGPDRKFQIIFWNNGTEDAFPSGSPTYATRPNIEGAKRAIENIFAFGKSDLTTSLDKAMAANPSEVILVTGKAWDLDEAFVDTVMNSRKDSDARIHTIAVGGVGQSAAFKTIAEKSGGQFRELTEGELRAMVK